MKFLMTYIPSTDPSTAEPNPAQLVEIQRLTKEMMDAGIVKVTGGLLPLSQGGARVRSRRGKFEVVDGPYTEAKEVVVGFSIAEAESLEQAILLTQRFMAVAGEGESEIRAIVEPPSASSA